MGRGKIEERLSGYWKMEAANVAFIPLGLAFLATTFGWDLGLASFAALAAVCLLLAVGAIYWFRKLEQLRSGNALPRQIGLLAAFRLPCLLLCVAAVILTLIAWTLPGVATSQADRWASLVLTLLALAEYVNYYHRQVQHFDHAADFSRLVRGRGFRRSQMAMDIARWRRTTPRR